jgi:glutathione S-transferase
MKYLLSQSERHICFLGGCDNKTTGLVNMWVDFCTFNIWPVYPHTVGQVLGTLPLLLNILGRVPTNQDVFRGALEDLKEVLAILNHHLTFKTFLVGTAFSYADLFVASSLNPFFSLVIDRDVRAQFPHVVRWYLFISNVREISSVN